jgi:hypothetical protein
MGYKTMKPVKSTDVSEKHIVSIFRFYENVRKETIVKTGG